LLLVWGHETAIDNVSFPFVYASQRRRRRLQRRIFTLLFFAAVVALLALFVLVVIPNLSGGSGDTGEQAAAGSEADNADANTEGSSNGNESGGGSSGEQVEGTVVRAETPDAESIKAPEAQSPKPEAVKGIYMTAPAASGPNLSAYLDLLDITELNAVVVDVKDVTGEVMYPSEVPLANEVGATRNVIPDLESLVAELEDHDVYSIARIAVFEDDILPRERPDLAIMDSATGQPWVNYSDIAWADPYDREVWEYNVAIAREAAEAGFDEIQFDYIRFPSDGPMETLAFEEETYPDYQSALGAFLEYARGELASEDVYLAADVFGLAATDDGAGVGQYMDKLMPHLDVICPMAYPSHYPAGSYGVEAPNYEPYKIVLETMKDFEEDAQKANPDIEIRPWIQDFDYTEPPYGAAEVAAQMQAIYDADETGWLLWNPENIYTDGSLRPHGEGRGPDSPGNFEAQLSAN
jgi:hypothetical protein